MKSLLFLLPLGYLWFCLINNLRVEWSTNPQYAYGWVVPLLCLGLLLRRWQSFPADRPLTSGSVLSPPPSVEGPLASSPMVSGPVVLLLSLLALLFLPTRLAEAAVPEWRLIQWVLALQVVGMTLGAIYLGKGPGGLRQLAYPICFFLVAVPWPSFFDRAVIQALTRANVAVVIELMGWLGEPAMQHGNVIEVSTGVVGIDEACSGIRSFQSSLMISLFLGEFYRLTTLRRLLLVPAGFLIAIAFNVCRTSLLTWVAAKKGIAAISQYHDPAGFAILLACSAVMWALAFLLWRNQKPTTPAPAVSGQWSVVSSPSSPLPRFALALILWLVVCEAGIFLWYRSRESHFTSSPNWSLVFPRDNPTFTDLVITEKEKAQLRFDEAREGEWQAPDGTRWQGYYLAWAPGKVAAYLAKRHTPEICLTSSGRKLRSGPELLALRINGVDLPMRQYVFETDRGLLHVFHSRWEPGTTIDDYVAREPGRYSYLRGIWAGRGNRGQKVLEFIGTGFQDAGQAKEALVRQLETLIRVESPEPAKAK
jgi:exosortase